ncbi:GNAT family protein [Tessaracoccus lubricantis]|uniref:GNAT family protein n=1 Tax=Tessaracoccus lubricantis TaxID=545543 RepID=A0ABP9F9R3_9ACTN
MVALPPPAEPLTGRFVRLEPFAESDADELAHLLLDPALYTNGYVMYSTPRTHAEAVDRVWTWWANRHRSGEADRISYAVRLTGDGGLGPAGTLVGTTSLGPFDLGNQATFLGYTIYGRRWWGAPVNPEGKYLLLGQAFERLGYTRVQIQTDVLNVRSQAAIEKLGAVREGVLRRHKVREDGSSRDSVFYSIIAEEWPRVKAGLEARLGGWTPVLDAHASSDLPALPATVEDGDDVRNALMSLTAQLTVMQQAHDSLGIQY